MTSKSTRKVKHLIIYVSLIVFLYYIEMVELEAIKVQLETSKKELEVKLDILNKIN